MRERETGGLTLIEAILVLLALLAATGKVVDLAHKAAALLIGLGLLVVLVVAPGQFVDKVHDAVWHVVSVKLQIGYNWV